jgi:hypothetical protein
MNLKEETNKMVNISFANINIQDDRLKKEKGPKKRVDSFKWTFSNEFYEYHNQLKIITDIFNNNFENNDEISKIVIQQINKKISGYKQQDIFKKRLQIHEFLHLRSVIEKMIECNLKCRYCSNEMFVLYDISREIRQWSVDRIDNDKGHNIDNFHLACLDCNLKRRRRTDEKYLFTKQLSIVKLNNL